MREVVSRSLTLRGFLNTEFAAQRPAFLNDVSGWIADGRVLYREDVVVGLERAPEAFIGMLEGLNFGKLLVDVTGTP
jgi:NADPH-dependent curcumin reductase CurA